MTNPLRRFEQTARLEHCDCVPVALVASSSYVPSYAGMDYRDYYALPSRWHEANVTLARRFPDVLLLPGFCVEWGMAQLAGAYGVRMHFHRDQPPSCSPLVKDVRCWANVAPIDPHEHGPLPLILRQQRVAEEMLQAEGFGGHFAFSWGPMSLASAVMGITGLMEAIVDEPQATARTLESMTTSSIRWLEAQLEVLREPAGIFIGDDVSGLVSTCHFKELVLPRLQRLFAGFDGLLKVYHNDTPCRHLVQSLPDAGFDLWHFSHELDIGSVAREIGHRVALMGNVPPLSVGLRGSPEDVRRSAQECIRSAEGRSLVLSFGGGIPCGSPPENVDALVEATVGF